jgi:ParB-like chromosome segregation protein Spo0J
MATKVNAGDVKRGDLLFVDPFEVQVKEELRGRHKPPTEEAVIKMAMSLLEHGQLEPVECRKIENHRLQLTLGFTRTAAVRLIRTGFTDTEGVVHPADKEFRLKVVITDTNDDLAFIRNIVENAHRNATTPMDDAFNQQRLRDKYGKSDADIARLYQYKGQGMVTRLKKLLALDSRFQEMVHVGTLSINGALELLDLPADQRDAALQAATDQDSGKVNATDLRAQVRDRILADAEAAEEAGAGAGDGAGDGDDSVIVPPTGVAADVVIGDGTGGFGDGTPAPTGTDAPAASATATGKPKKKAGAAAPGANGTPAGNPPAKPRTLREERATLQAFADAEEVDPAVKKACLVFIGHINGTKSDKQLLNAFYALLDAKRTV